MSLAENWRNREQKLRFVGEECPYCNTPIFPPRDICPNCGENATTKAVMPDRGEVYSYSTVYDAPEGFENQAPYTVALVRLTNGVMITTQLTDIDNDKVAIGMPVERVTRKLNEDGRKGIINYGFKFRPLLEVQGQEDSR